MSNEKTIFLRISSFEHWQFKSLKLFPLQKVFATIRKKLESEMTLVTFFWILIGVIILLLMAIRFGIKKELLTPIFWLLIGISFMVLMGILWNAIYS